jgi:hypothetical protein
MASRKKRDDDSADRPTLSLVSDGDSNPRVEQDPTVDSSSDAEEASDAVEGVDPSSTETDQDEGVESETPANSELGRPELGSPEIPGLSAMSSTEQAQAILEDADPVAYYRMLNGLVRSSHSSLLQALPYTPSLEFHNPTCVVVEPEPSNIETVGLYITCSSSRRQMSPW